MEMENSIWNAYFFNVIKEAGNGARTLHKKRKPFECSFTGIKRNEINFSVKCNTFLNNDHAF